MAQRPAGDTRPMPLGPDAPRGGTLGPMELLIVLAVMVTVAVAVVAWGATTTGYRVKNRDVRPHYSAYPTRDRPPGPDLSNMLD